MVRCKREPPGLRSLSRADIRKAAPVPSYGIKTADGHLYLDPREEAINIFHAAEDRSLSIRRETACHRQKP